MNDIFLGTEEPGYELFWDGKWARSEERGPERLSRTWTVKTLATRVPPEVGTLFMIPSGARCKATYGTTQKPALRDLQGKTAGTISEPVLLHIESRRMHLRIKKAK
jgi:hypothetical protein